MRRRCGPARTNVSGESLRNYLRKTRCRWHWPDDALRENVSEKRKREGRFALQGSHATHIRIPRAFSRRYVRCRAGRG